MTLRAVLWDLGGVILRTMDKSGRTRWEQRLGLQPGQLERIVFDDKVGRQATLGKASSEDVWTSVLATLGLPESERQPLFDDFFGGDRVDDRLVGFIRSLRPRYKTGMITNAWPDIRHWIDEVWGLSSAFDIVVVSAEVGLAKPDPRIYRLALERLAVMPEEVVFIDDFKENVEAAIVLGLRGIHFEKTDQVLEQLLELMALAG